MSGCLRGLCTGVWAGKSPVSRCLSRSALGGGRVGVTSVGPEEPGLCFPPSQLLAVVASTILDLVRNMRAFGGILAVSLAACAGPSGEWSWAVGEPGLNRRPVAFGSRVPVLGERVTRAQEAQGGAGSQREELRAGLAGGAA